MEILPVLIGLETSEAFVKPSGLEFGEVMVGL